MMVTEWHVLLFVGLCALSLTRYLRVSLRRRARLIFLLLYGSIGLTGGIYVWFLAGNIPAPDRVPMGRMAFIFNYFILTIIFETLHYINKKHE